MSSSTSLASSRLFYSEGSPYARICRMALREGGLIANVQGLAAYGRAERVADALERDVANGAYPVVDAGFLA